MRANFFIWAYWPKIGKVHISSILLTFLCSMRPFWKCLIVSKILVRTKLKFYLFLQEVGPNFHIWASWSKIEKVQISLVLSTFLCSTRPFWKCHIFSEILVKISLKFYPFFFWGMGGEGVGDLELISTFKPSGPKFKKWPQIEILQSSWSVKYIADFLLPRINPGDFEKTMFLKYC